MHINFLMLLVGGVAAMVVGMVWHSKALFGPAYMKALGADMNMSTEKMVEIQKKMWQLYTTQFLLSIFQFLILSIFVIRTLEVFPVATAFWIWAGFLMPTVAGSAMWSARPRKDAWKIFLISAGYQLVLFVVFGFIIKAWM